MRFSVRDTRIIISVVSYKFVERKKATVEPVKNQALAQKSGLMQAERGTSADVSVSMHRYE